MALAFRKMETFSSHKYFQRLIKAGFTDEQAEVQIAMVGDASRSGLEHLATKADIADLRTEMTSLRAEFKEDTASLRAELKEDIARLDNKINTSKWQTMGSIFSLLILLPVIQLLSKHFGF
jgi:hypothetical protein